MRGFPLANYSDFGCFLPVFVTVNNRKSCHQKAMQMNAADYSIIHLPSGKKSVQFPSKNNLVLHSLPQWSPLFMIMCRISCRMGAPHFMRLENSGHTLESKAASSDPRKQERICFCNNFSFKHLFLKYGRSKTLFPTLILKFCGRYMLRNERREKHHSKKASTGFLAPKSHSKISTYDLTLQ